MNIFILEDDQNRMKVFKKKFINHHLEYTDQVEEAKTILTKTKFDYIFLDHDLGGRVYVNSNEENTGFQLAKWIRDNKIECDKIIIHSLNPVGAVNMQRVLTDAEHIPFIYLWDRIDINK